MIEPKWKTLARNTEADTKTPANEPASPASQTPSSEPLDLPATVISSELIDPFATAVGGVDFTTTAEVIPTKTVRGNSVLGGSEDGEVRLWLALPAKLP